MDLQFEKPDLRSTPGPLVEEDRYACLRKDSAQFEREQVDRLLARLRKIAGSRKLMRNIARVTGWMAIANLCAAVGIYGFYSLVIHHPATLTINLHRLGVMIEGNGTDLSLGGGWLLVTAIILAASLVARSRARKQGEATRWLAEFDDLRAAGPLAEALNLGDRDLRATAEVALIPLLNRIQASDSELLTPAQRACLRGAVRYDCTDFSVAVLKALEQVGDESDLRFAQSLLLNEIRQKGAAAWNAAIREAAKDCSAAIRQRIAAEKARGTLLRPAEPSDLGSLLRPAGTTDTGFGLLLRASSGDTQS